MNQTQSLNREGWLTEAGRIIEPLFRPLRVGAYRVTCGWPCKGGTSLKRRRVGECHPVESSRAGVSELFISPVLDGFGDVTGTLVHEMAHVVAGVKAGHGRGFVRVCRHVGLTKGKATSAEPGERLAEQVAKLLEPLGKYPHSALVPKGKPKKPPGVVGLECAGCGCKVTISFKWLGQSGPPVCGCGKSFLNPEPEEGE
jgi:hypothetical protein